MKRFTAQLNDGSFINVEATRMKLAENMVLVYEHDDLVALVDISAVVSAHISERGASGER